MNWLYLDCFSGVSGDMFIGSLLDLGVPIEYLKDALSKLDISVDISCDKQVVKGIASTKFIVEN